MWLYFNKQRTLVEQINHNDEPARVGSIGAFKIFAFFEGIDTSEYTTATIHLQKPDRTETLYPEFPGTITTRYFDVSKSPENLNYFKNDTSYTGFIFDFNIYGLLDMPGMWKATISLYKAGQSVRSVAGELSFNVQDAVYDEEDVVIDSEIYQQILMTLADKMNVKGSKVIRFVDDISDFEFDSAVYSDGDLILDKTTKDIYILDWTESEIQGESGHFEYSLFVRIGTGGGGSNLRFNDNETVADQTEMLQSITDMSGVEIKKYTVVSERLTPEASGTDLSLVNTGDMANWNAKQDELTFDSAPTESSTNPVTSGGIYTALGDKVTKVSDANKVYATDNSGNQTTLDISVNASNNYVVKRDYSGNIVLPISGPTLALHAVSKKYADEIREVAEGKCKAYVSSWSMGIISYIFENAKKFDTKETFTGEEDFNDYVSGYTYGNEDFNNNGDSVYIASNKYYIFWNSEDLFVAHGQDWIDDMKLGDILYIIETGVPDRWMSGTETNGTVAVMSKLETSKVDLTPYETKTAHNVDVALLEDMVAPLYNNQLTYSVGQYVAYEKQLYRCSTAVTIAEDFDPLKWTNVHAATKMVDLDSAQTMSGLKTFNGGANFGFANIKFDNYVYKIAQASNDNNCLYGNTNSLYTPNILPMANNQKDIGSASVQYKDAYFAGQVYAQNTINVINASDIVSNTLTQAQFDLITNGKPTLVKGTISSLTDILLISGTLSSANQFRGVFIAHNEFGQSYFGTYIIQSNNLSIIFNKTFYTFPDGRVAIYNKPLPAYPTANANKQVLTIGASGGALSWEDKGATVTVGSLIQTDNLETGYTAPDNYWAYFEKILTESEIASIPDSGMAVIMFNTTCVTIPYVKGSTLSPKDNRFVANVVYDGYGSSDIAKGKIVVSTDAVLNGVINISLDKSIAQKLYTNGLHPYAVVRFVGF